MGYIKRTAKKTKLGIEKIFRNSKTIVNSTKERAET